MSHLKVAVASIALVGIFCGCGPTITETRMAYSPPLPEECEIKVANVPTTSLGPDNTQYEVVGSLSVQSTEHVDPFTPELLAELRPRACKLGGEEISLGINTNVEGGGSATTYNILKKKSGAPAAPATAPEGTAAPAP